MSSKNNFRILWTGFLLLTAYWMFRLWGHFPAFMDTLEYVFPEKWFNVESWRHGQVPLWNPYLDCGTPHLANLQSAPFYPFFWIWNLTGLTDWFFVVALAHGLLAAVGSYLWFRALKVSQVPGSLCALGFAGSALLVHYWGFPTHMASLSWVPWIFWGTLRLSRERTWASWGWVVLFWSLQILAGYPFFSFYTGIFWVIFIQWKLRASTREKLLHVSVVGTALVVTACQWIPFLDFLGYLYREGRGEQTFSLRWVNYLTLLQPQFLGTPGTAGYQGDYPSFIFNNLYLGIVPLGIFLWSFFSPLSRDAFWKRSALVWLVWLSGIHFLVWKSLPDVLLDRLEPAKASFLFVFCAFTAIGLALQEKIDATPSRSPLRKWAWVLGLLWMADLLSVPSRVIQTVPDPYRNPQVVQAAEKARQWAGEGRLVSLRSQSDYYSSEVAGLSDSMRETAQALLGNTGVVWGLRSAKGYLTIRVDGHQNLDRYLRNGYPYDGRVLDAAGVRLIVFPGSLPSFKYGLFEKEGPTVFTRNAGAMGGAWETGRARSFPDRPEVFKSLLDPKAFLENEVYTEQDPKGGAVRLSGAKRQMDDYSPSKLDRLASWWRRLFHDETTIERSRPSPCEARFEVSSSHAGFLVFNESFSPGWHAWVDGKPKPIFRAYGLWMAVLLPTEGSHQAVFRYEPVSFRLGLFLTLVALSALGTGFCLRRVRSFGRS